MWFFPWDARTRGHLARVGPPAFAVFLFAAPVAAQTDAPVGPPPTPADGAAPSETLPPTEAPAASTPPGAPSSVPPPPALSPEELLEIQRATRADAAALSKGPPAPAPAAGAPPATVASLLPDIAVIMDVAAAGFTSETNYQKGEHDPSQNGFNLQAVELSLGKSVDPYFRFDANFAFTLEGVEVEEAYATTSDLPANLQLRAGQMLTRFGRLNATHPHAWDFVDRPFVLGRFFGGDGNRGVGVELSYLTPLPWYVELVASSSNATGETTNRSFYGASDGAVESPADLKNLLALKQFFELSDNWSLFTGVSAATAPNASATNARTEIYGADLYLKYRPITYPSSTVVALQAEWLARRRDAPRDRLVDHGGYVQLAWRFAERWGTAARYEYGSPVYDQHAGAAVDPLDPTEVGRRQRVSANLTFWPSEYSRLRLQGSGDFPAWAPHPVGAVFLALEVAVGSHRAHKF